MRNSYRANTKRQIIKTKNRFSWQNENTKMYVTVIRLFLLIFFVMDEIYENIYCTLVNFKLFTGSFS